MNKKLFIAIMISLFTVGCSYNQSSFSEPQAKNLPDSAKQTDEDDWFSVYINIDGKTDNDINRAYVWVLDKRNSTASLAFVDSLYNISNASIIPYTDPCRVLAEGCPDMRNIYSFIAEEGKEPKMLPSIGGLLGFGRDEGVIIMQGYQYYHAGGRYSKIEAYDADGNKIASMNTNLKPDTLLR